MLSISSFHSNVNSTYYDLNKKQSLVVNDEQALQELVKMQKDKDVEDMAICDLYDLLESNGIIQQTLDAIKEINPNEVKELISYADLAYEEFKESINSASAAVNSLVIGMTQSLASVVSAAKVIQNNK